MVRLYMRLLATVAGLAFCLPTTLQAAQDELESVMWELVSQTNEPEKLDAFIESFPESVHVEEARARLNQLASREQNYALEDSIFTSVGNVSYSVPLSFGDDHLIGRTLPQIIEGSPAYPPVEGLPEEMWKDRSCSSCHQWTRETLCVQANNYVAMDPAKYREKMHPYGGLLKINLRNWAQNDCQ